MLSGQAKTDYQREYMRKRRSNTRSNRPDDNVRPEAGPVRPEDLCTINDTCPICPHNGDCAEYNRPVEPQSHSPMMAGYVPPVRKYNTQTYKGRLCAAEREKQING